MKNLTVRINIRNSYGIEGLLESLNFSNKNNVYVIYGSNGIGKTSLTKSLKDFSENKKNEINNITGEKIKINVSKNTKFLIIESIMQKDLSFGKRLLSLSVEEQNKINSLEKNIDDAFLKCLKKIKKNEIKETFFVNREFTYEEFIEFIVNFKEENFILEDSLINNYTNIFNEKVRTFLISNIDLITSYIERYKYLETKSEILKNNFDYQNSQNLILALNETKFFNVGGIYFKNNVTKIENISEIKNLIENEINKIIDEKELKENFSKIEAKLDKNKELKLFKDWLKNNEKWLKFFENYDLFKKNVLFKNVSSSLEEIQNLKYKINEYREAIQNSFNLENRWQEILNNFKNTFLTPINLEIKKVNGYILNNQNLEIEINYELAKNIYSNNISKNDVWETLSQGEKRTVYLLDVMYKIKEIQDKNTIIVFDDIVDSFDYKNKQAIVNYFCQLKRDGYNLLILTHNFDFFRTLDYRLKPNLLFMKKTDSIDQRTKKIFKKLNLEKFSEDYDVFKDWVNPKNIDKDIGFLLANIAFTRQISDYHNNMDLKLFCTNCLHLKNGTKNITINEIYEKICFFNNIEKNDNFIREYMNKKYVNVLYEYCENLLDKKEDSFLSSLKNKVCLSVGIRLQAEEYMINKLKAHDKKLENEINKINTMQTYALFLLCLNNLVNIDEQLMNKVITFTSESIHLNSFMFEPLLDLEIEQLVNIYINLREKNESINN